MSVHEYSGRAPAFVGAVGKRRCGQELAGLLAEVLVMQERLTEAWILRRDEYTALGAAPFTTWPEGPVSTADQFEAALNLVRELGRAARIVADNDADDVHDFPVQGDILQSDSLDSPRLPQSWSEAVMHYDYVQAEAMLELGLAYLAPEDRYVKNAFRPSEEGESIGVLDHINDPEYQEAARQHTPTKFLLLGDALYRDDQRALATQYLELAYTLSDPASPLANHMTLLGGESRTLLQRADRSRPRT